jgi:hypothetical protein
MEADWSVEVGLGLPTIDGLWEGFLDLRTTPSAIDGIEEALQHRALRETLLVLNAANSLMFTTKCDTWELTEQEIDCDEFGGSTRPHDLDSHVISIFWCAILNTLRRFPSMKNNAER